MAYKPAVLVVPEGGTGSSQLTNHGVLVGHSTGAVTGLTPSPVAGTALISQGSGSDPAFGTVIVSSGGTGATTLTIHGVLIGQTTGAITATTAGTTGQVFMGSTGADPSFTSTPTFAGSVTLNGGLIEKRTATAVSYTVLVTDVIVAVTSTAAARTITMPNSGLVAGQRWTIKDESGVCSINNITISGNGANVDGSASQVINTNYGSVDIYCDGTNFFLC